MLTQNSFIGFVGTKKSKSCASNGIKYVYTVKNRLRCVWIHTTHDLYVFKNPPDNQVKDAENIYLYENSKFVCKNLLEIQLFSFFVLELWMLLVMFQFFVLDKLSLMFLIHLLNLHLPRIIEQQNPTKKKRIL